MSEQSSPQPTVEDLRDWLHADSADDLVVGLERYCDPLLVADSVPEMFGPFRTRAAYLAFVKEYWSMWESLHQRPEELVDLGHGVTFAVIREEGRAKDGGAQIETLRSWVIQSDGGLIVHVTTYEDVQEARAAAERLAEERG